MRALGVGDGAPQWEPSTPGAPAPWAWSSNPDGAGSYPRYHQYPITYGKLGQYQLKQVEDTLGSWSFASFSLDGAPFTASGEATVLQAAEQRMPLVLVLGSGSHRAVFAVHPFGDFRKQYTLQVDVDGSPRSLTVTGKWPTLVRL